MTNEQIGEILFWLIAAALLLALLGLFLDVRIRIRPRILAISAGILAIVGAFFWAVANLPPEVIGGWLTWGSLAGMWFGLFWALTRGK